MIMVIIAHAAVSFIEKATQKIFSPWVKIDTTEDVERAEATESKRQPIGFIAPITRDTKGIVPAKG